MHIYLHIYIDIRINIYIYIVSCLSHCLSLSLHLSVSFSPCIPSFSFLFCSPSLSLPVSLSPSITLCLSFLSHYFFPKTKTKMSTFKHIYIYICIGSFCSVLFSFQCDACAHVRSQEHEVLNGFLKHVRLRMHKMVSDALIKSLPSPASVGHRQIKTGHASFAAKLLRCVGAQCILALLFLSSDDFPPN